MCAFSRWPFTLQNGEIFTAQYKNKTMSCYTETGGREEGEDIEPLKEQRFVHAFSIAMNFWGNEDASCFCYSANNC